MSVLLGDCLWCHREIEWDHYAGGWRHTESRSLLCPNGSQAAIDLDTADVNGTVTEAVQPPATETAM